MSETKHTPTPWVVAITHKGHGIAVRGGASNDRPKGAWPIYAINLGVDEQTRADAELIVRAVNNHEALLAACHAALEMRAQMFIATNALSDIQDRIAASERARELSEQIRAAIKKAEGES